MSALERRAMALWRWWGTYDTKSTTCERCGVVRVCRKRSARGRWTCLDCFDEGHR